MEIFKASDIDSSISIPYKTMHFENNMRVTNPFTLPINVQSSEAMSKKYVIQGENADSISLDSGTDSRKS